MQLELEVYAESCTSDKQSFLITIKSKAKIVQGNI